MYLLASLVITAFLCFPQCTDILFQPTTRCFFFSLIAQKIACHLITRYCNNLELQLASSFSKTENLFSVKTQHFSTCVHEHLATDRASHFFNHVHSNEKCNCFTVNDTAAIPFQLKLKALHIFWNKPVISIGAFGALPSYTYTGWRNQLTVEQLARDEMNSTSMYFIPLGLMRTA